MTNSGRAAILRRSFVIALGLASIALHSIASEPPRPPSPSSLTTGYHHRAWTSKDGAPDQIQLLAQTNDGWLWMGTPSGLYRFDGVAFHSVELPGGKSASRQVVALYPSRNGDLWVGFAFGELVRVARGDPAEMSVPPSLPNGAYVRWFAEDGGGRIFAFTPNEKFALSEGHWVGGAMAWGLPAGEIRSTTLDGQATLWASASDGVYSLQRGTDRFVKRSTNALNGAALVTSQAGQVWKADGTGFAPFEAAGMTNDAHEESEFHQGNSSELFTRDHTLWIASPHGVKRIQPQDVVSAEIGDSTTFELFGVESGLSSDRVMGLLEDRDGSVWIGTKRGLDQFRRTSFTSVRFPEGVGNFSIAADPHSGIWMGTAAHLPGVSDRLWRLDPTPIRVDNFSAPLVNLYVDANDDILLGGLEALSRVRGVRVDKMPAPPGNPGTTVRALARDGAGRLWASRRPGGIFRLDGETWTAGSQISPALSGNATIAAVAERGEVWFGFADNRVARVDGTTAQSYSGDEGLAIGAVSAILAGDPMLFAGERGISAFDGKRFWTLTSAHPEALQRVTGMVRTSDGTLWLNGGSGAVEVRPEDWLHAVADHAYPLPVRLFDSEDGLPGVAQSVGNGPTVVEDRQHRLWFAESDGLAWLDPRVLRRVLRFPPAEIDTVETPSHAYAAKSGLTLPVGTRSVDIGYTAISLAVPERTWFRVRLSGVDAEWKEASTARRASYTNLDPGTYRFEVRASNPEGEWGADAAVFDFAITPAFYQTVWFKMGAVAIALIAALMLIRLQTRRLAWRASASLRDRMKERERIARELHDTLIQDVEALALNLRAINRRTDEAPAPGELVQLEQAAQRSVESARRRVGGLRADRRSTDVLPKRLEEFAQQLTALYPTRFAIHLEGHPCGLEGAAEEEIFAIAHEALLNAFRHARATCIDMTLEYAKKALTLSVCDDGVGLPAQVLAVGAADGHFGLLGLAERARAVKGRLTIESSATQGTQVRLIVPARFAYSKRRSA